LTFPSCRNAMLFAMPSFESLPLSLPPIQGLLPNGPIIIVVPRDISVLLSSLVFVVPEGCSVFFWLSPSFLNTELYWFPWVGFSFGILSLAFFIGLGPQFQLCSDTLFDLLCIFYPCFFPGKATPRFAFFHGPSCSRFLSAHC